MPPGVDQNGSHSPGKVSSSFESMKLGTGLLTGSCDCSCIVMAMP